MPGQAASPFEVIVGPMQIWAAPSDTPLPLRAFLAAWAGEDDAMNTNVWKPIPRSGGDSGALRQVEEGVTISFNQTVDPIRSTGSTLPIKYVRTQEDINVQFQVEDASALSVAAALQDAGNPDAGVTSNVAASPYPAYKQVSLERGATVLHNALICRGQSPYGTGGSTMDWNALYYMPKAAQIGQPSPNFSKNGAAMWQFEFSTLRSDTLKSLYVAQDSEA